jgi:hypothetical protein
MHTTEFLTPESARKPGVKQPSRVLRVLLVLVLGFFIVVGGFVGAVAVMGYSVRSDMRTAMSALKQLDVQKATASVVHAETTVTRLHGMFVLTSPFETLPFVGAEFSAARLSTQAGMDALASAELLLKPLGGIVDHVSALAAGGESAVTAFRTMAPETKREILQAILSAGDDVNRAAVRFRRADDALAGVPSDQLMDLLRVRFDPIRTSVHEARRDFDTMIPLLKLVPELLGGTREQTFLFVFQNNDELRPAGGFIGNYGIFSAKNGDFSVSDIRDVYSLDRPATPFFREVPPWQFVKYLSADGWYFRDANWSPDWPTSAATLLDFYTREKGEKGSAMNGVIALSPRLIQRMSELVGCITVQDVEFCPNNIIPQIQYEVEKGYDAKGLTDAERKQILKPLAAEFMKRLYSLPTAKLPQVFEIVREAFAAKDVLLWSMDNDVEAAAVSAGIAGRVAWTTPDGLMVVDANLGGMKTDPFTKRTVAYSVVPDGSSYIGKVAITYHNTAPGETFKTTTYRDFARVYLPPGSQWISTEGSLDHDVYHNPRKLPGKTEVRDDLGLTSIGAFTAVGIGETRTLSFTFRLAPQVIAAIRRGEYALTVLRQPGSPDPALTVDLRFGKNQSPHTFAIDLTVDRMFTVISNK